MVRLVRRGSGLLSRLERLPVFRLAWGDDHHSIKVEQTMKSQRKVNQGEMKENSPEWREGNGGRTGQRGNHCLEKRNYFLDFVIKH